MATQRVITLVDMDCFYCQVEARLDASLVGKPVAVVQYNQWKGGGIIAVNYEARAEGVTRYMRGSEAKQKCPTLVLVSVPTVRGKADLTKYRDAGEEVAEVFCSFSDCVQRASVDEAYIDITKMVNQRILSGVERVQLDALPNTFVVGHNQMNSNDLDARKQGVEEWLQAVDEQHSTQSPEFKLAVGALIVEEMRLAILQKTGFHCSAGIAHNKILAKLAAGLHKPKCQTILPHDSVPELYETLPVNKVRSLGGKMGKLVASKLQISYMSELYKFSLAELQQKVDDKTGSWLYNIARGIDLEPVTTRLCPESIGCCKNFPGKNALNTRTVVDHWLQELAAEVAERLARDLQKNRRRARQLTVSFCLETPMSRSGPLTSYQAAGIAQDAFNLLAKFNTAPQSSDHWTPPIKYMGISVGKFIQEQASIGRFLQARTEKIPQETEEEAGKSKYFQTEPIEGNMGTGDSISDEQRNSNSPIEGKEEIMVEEKVEEEEERIKQAEVDTSSSFFLSFIKKTKEAKRAANIAQKSAEGEEREGENTLCPNEEETTAAEATEEAWISLSEVIPDVTKADTEVVQLLPKNLRDKFQERLRDAPSTSAAREVCAECGKGVALTEFLEHSDYHAAVKLHAQINQKTTPGPASPAKSTAGSRVKRKRTQNKQNSIQPKGKKAKAITSFFSVIPK